MIPCRKSNKNCNFFTILSYESKSHSITRLASRKQTLTQIQIQEEYLLVEAAKKNSRRFGVLYERYYEQIFLFVFKRVSNEEASADVTSQVFLKAITNLHKYQFKGVPFSAWLYRIAINEVNQHFRETRNQRSISLESANLAEMMEEVEVNHSDENIRLLLAALQELSPDEIQLIELRYFERMPFREVAEVYNITENNAKVKMYRLLMKMKKILTKRRVEV